MKTLIIALLISGPAFAEDCLKMVEERVLYESSKELGTSPSKLQVRYVGGESLDGDTTSDGGYNNPSWELFDVFLASENPKTAKPLALYFAHIEEITYPNSVQCDFSDFGKISEDEWDYYYDIYHI